MQCRFFLPVRMKILMKFVNIKKYIYELLTVVCESWHPVFAYFTVRFEVIIVLNISLSSSYSENLNEFLFISRLPVRMPTPSLSPAMRRVSRKFCLAQMLGGQQKIHDVPTRY